MEPWLADIDDLDDRATVEAAFRRYRQRVVPVLPQLRGAVVHQDANDHNVLAVDGLVSGLIDFGDMVFARQVNELAVTLAYALLDVPDVVAAGRDVIAGYTAEFALTDDELAVALREGTLHRNFQGSPPLSSPPLRSARSGGAGVRPRRWEGPRPAVERFDRRPGAPAGRRGAARIAASRARRR